MQVEACIEKGRLTNAVASEYGQKLKKFIAEFGDSSGLATVTAFRLGTPATPACEHNAVLVDLSRHDDALVREHRTEIQAFRAVLAEVVTHELEVLRLTALGGAEVSVHEASPGEIARAIATLTAARSAVLEHGSVLAKITEISPSLATARSTLTTAFAAFLEYRVAHAQLYTRPDAKDGPATWEAFGRVGRVAAEARRLLEAAAPAAGGGSRVGRMLSVLHEEACRRQSDIGPKRAEWFTCILQDTKLHQSADGECTLLPTTLTGRDGRQSWEAVMDTLSGGGEVALSPEQRDSLQAAGSREARAVPTGAVEQPFRLAMSALEATAHLQQAAALALYAAAFRGAGHKTTWAAVTRLRRVSTTAADLGPLDKQLSDFSQRAAAEDEDHAADAAACKVLLPVFTGWRTVVADAEHMLHGLQAPPSNLLSETGHPGGPSTTPVAGVLGPRDVHPGRHRRCFARPGPTRTFARFGPPVLVCRWHSERVRARPRLPGNLGRMASRRLS